MKNIRNLRGVQQAQKGRHPKQDTETLICARTGRKVFPLCVRCKQPIDENAEFLNDEKGAWHLSCPKASV